MTGHVPYRYDPGAFPPFAVTADVALFTIRNNALQLLLIERGREPFLGAKALPGGFVQQDEDLEDAAVRELAEETGLTAGPWYLEQLAAYGAPDRDPRMRVVTVAFWAVCASLPASPRGGGDAAGASLVQVKDIESGVVRLAFDHARIVGDAVERIRTGMEHTALAAGFCPPEFTIRQLRRVYETVWGVSLDPGNFQRYVRDSGAFEQSFALSEAATAETRPEAGPPALHEPSFVLSGPTRVDRRSEPGRPASLWTARRTESGRPATAGRRLARPGREQARSR